MNWCKGYLGATEQAVRNLAQEWLPDGPVRRILIKPNWVMHESDARFPIRALVTGTWLIEQVVEACLERYPDLERITVGDVPLQTCEWDVLAAQSGIAELAGRYQQRRRGPQIEFLDLRRERFQSVDGFQVRQNAPPGDPRGYREVVLDKGSLLEEVTGDSTRFGVSDYDPAELASTHGPGRHRYLVSGSALESDLLINLPKMKTHQKAGVTGALKNLVGINGQKAFLAHYRIGRPSQGGDEFPPDSSRLIEWQSRIRHRLQKRSRLLFGLGRVAWRVVKSARGIETVGTANNLDKRFYRAGGAWPGNDTIWRMVYDLNRIVLFAGPEGGTLRREAQRKYLTILDGVTAGEGNGPLQPLPVDAGLLLASNNPFLADWVMALAMGFEPAAIPQLQNFKRLEGEGFGDFDPDHDLVEWNGSVLASAHEVPCIHRFTAPPGWGSIQRGGR